MTIRRKFLLKVVPIVLIPLILFWVAFQFAILGVVKDTETLESNIVELASLSENTQKEALQRLEMAMKEAYSFALSNIGANMDGQLDSIEKSLLLSSVRDDVARFLEDPVNEESRVEVSEYFEDLIETHGLAECRLIANYGRPVLSLSSREGATSGVEVVPTSLMRTRRETLAEPWFLKALNTDSGTSWDVFEHLVHGGESSSTVVSGAIAIQPSESERVLGYLQLVLPIEKLAEMIRGPAALTSSVRLVDENHIVRWRNADEEVQTFTGEDLFISQSVRGGIINAEVTIPRSVLNANLTPYERLSTAMEKNVTRIQEHGSDLHRTINKVSVLMFITKLLLVLVATVLVWILLSRIASRIEVLSRAASRIRDGNLDTPLPVYSKGDELDSLGRGIESMRLRIKSQIAVLDKKVEERTNELAHINRKLQLEIKERSKAEAEAMDANSAKSEFLATMSHEIRTPLNGILGGMNLLSQSAVDDEQRTLCEIISNSAKSLNTLVNDILDLAKIEARKLEFTSERFDLSRVLKEVCDTFQFKAHEKGIELLLEDRLQDTLLREGDPNRLKQIVYNLVGNAVKFTETGSVTVQVECRDNDPDLVRIKVVDTGIGMSPEQRDSIFQPFTQADGTINQKYGGTGLGLAISGRLAEQMNGKITVESVPSEGSTFTVEIALPISIGALESKPLVGSHSKMGKLAGSILVAEDNEVNRLIVNKVLSEAGFTVSTVSNGRECLEAVERERFDLILMDCAMPEMDGCSAARAIRSSGIKTDGVAIMGITAHATSQQKRRCEESGMNDVLFKPVDSSILVESCRRLMASDCA
ncbi:ATP-binding protein [Pelagicoccus albus]